MAFLIERDEATATRRRVPFRLFTSNGTSPDTNASDGTILWSVNGAAQLSARSISAISAAAGMYYVEFTASNVSVLGSIAVYTDVVATDFPQHVATVQVVNYNPMSIQSGVIIAGGSYSSTTVRLDLVAYSGATVGAGNFTPGVYSGVSFSVRDSGIANSSFQETTYSRVTVQGVINVDSGVSIRAGSHSGATIQGLSNYANISNVTLHAGTHSSVTIQGVTRINSNVTLNADTHSGATIQGLSNYANISNVTLAAGTHSSVTIQGISNYANISNVTLAAGSHSGVTIDGVRMLATPAERSIASSLLSTNIGGTRTVEQALFVLRNRVQISGSTMTVYLPDDTTSSWTATVSTGTATIYGIDPGIA